MIEALFNPVKRNDLSRLAKAQVGKRIRFLEGWVIDTGRYQGQVAWIPFDIPFAGWVPEEDLHKMKEIFEEV